MVKTTGGPALGASVSSPALTESAVSLLQDNLTEEERQLWTSLGPNWTHPRSGWPIAPHPCVPRLLVSGLEADGQWFGRIRPSHAQV
ncbi:epidermal growth factor receptor kinase substrate 8-like protein 1 [Lates japonicus]|uniref:Epidermal growth factor receptor kinase substrate 8-like protein 1 n=1 Tax=Lates japonicus TaxID=270547 RepID=A0AAD3MXC0_LATJO|nr:epidermal growth factor receptor kinase substrate 8-like protein 1 [Lates japonicus]